MTDTRPPAPDRDLHRVTTKVALYTPDYSHVLVTRMFSDTPYEVYGLPGGHIDEGEVPDNTIIREIDEELGIAVDGLTHLDFFVHGNGKIVLAYKGVIPFDTEFHPSDPAKEIGVWMSKPEFDQIKIDRGYKNLVLHNWQMLL